MNNIKFGIEIETVGLTVSRATQVLKSFLADTTDDQAAKMADGRRWKIVRDGSLPSVSAEIVSPILTLADLPLLQEVVRTLRRAGAKAHPQAGIHIHIDKKQLGLKGIINLAKMVYKQEDLLIRALGISERRLTTYTRRTNPAFINTITAHRPKNFTELQAAWYGDTARHSSHYDNSRYQILNLHAVFTGPTCEVRAFESTMHAGKIKAYVQLVVAMAAKAAASKSAQSKQRIYTPESAKYDLRCFLLKIGMIGDEFKTARLHLLANLPGDAAFKTMAQRRAHRAS